MSTIGYVTNASAQSGVGNRAANIRAQLARVGDFALQDISIDGDRGTLNENGHTRSVRSWPGILGSKSVNWLRLGRKVSTEVDLFHLTNQSLSFLARRLAPSIVTVHDLIEVREPQDWRAAFINRYLHRGIPHVQHIIVVSEHTKRELVHEYEVDPDMVTVIYNGVDDKVFQPINEYQESVACRELLRRRKLPQDQQFVLYVGSDHPRKNLGAALRAFAKARRQDIPLHFIKVGAPGYVAGREQTLRVMDELNLTEHVTIIHTVSDDELNELYNLASVFVYPSQAEGFGLPPLQAMAAGTPVITSNATSLPEVVGDDGIYGESAAHVHDPTDVEGIAQSLVQLLENETERAHLRQLGLRRSKKFRWDVAAEEVVGVYRLCLPR